MTYENNKNNYLKLKELYGGERDRHVYHILNNVNVYDTYLTFAKINDITKIEYHEISDYYYICNTTEHYITFKPLKI